MAQFGSRTEFELKETKRISNLVIMASSMYPFWGYAFTLLAKTHGYPWHNVGATSILISMWLWARWRKFDLAGWHRVMFFLATVALVHASYVVVDFGYSTIALAGYYIAVSVSFTILPILGMYLPFGGIGILSMISLAYFAPQGFPIIEIPIAAGTLMTVGVYTVYLRAKNQTEAERVESMGRELLNSMREGMVVQNRAGAIIAYNDSALKILGLTGDQLTGKTSMDPHWASIKEDCSPFPGEEHPAMVALRSGDPCVNVTMGVQLPAGNRRWIMINAVPIDDGGDPHAGAVFCTFLDMSDQRAQQAELDSQRVSLAKASRMTSLAEMASGVAHEINNPLMIVLSWVRKLESAVGENRVSPEDLVKGLSKIRTMSERVAKIVANMRSLSWDSSNEEVSEFQLKGVVDSVLDLCQERLNRNGVDLQVSVAQDVAMTGRSVQLSQVIVNLVTNASHAVEDLPQKWVKVESRVFATSHGDQVQIRVIDSGHGIPAAIREKIMQPFFTTKDPGKGTGLGLSISNELIAKSGGKLWIDDQYPNTCFVIDLPRLASQAASAQPKVAA